MGRNSVTMLATTRIKIAWREKSHRDVTATKAKKGERRSFLWVPVVVSSLGYVPEILSIKRTWLRRPCVRRCVGASLSSIEKHENTSETFNRINVSFTKELNTPSMDPLDTLQEREEREREGRYSNNE